MRGYVNLLVVSVLVVAFVGFSKIVTRNQNKHNTRSSSIDIDPIQRDLKEVHGSNKDVSELPPFQFDDLWDPKFSYNSFYPNWISNSEYLFRDEAGINIYNLDDRTNKTIVSDEFYKQTNASAWSISPDKLYLLVRTSYFKQWRSSYNGSYAIYRIADENNIFTLSNDDVQYIRWSPTGHALSWVVENDIYLHDGITPLNETNVVKVTSTGEKNKIFNGIPDWVYEEEMVFTNHNLFWSYNSRFLAYVVTDDSLVKQIKFSRFDHLKYPETIELAYPKAGTPNPKVKIDVYEPGSGNNFTVLAPTDLVTEDHLFSRFYWYPDSEAFLVIWMNRISNLSVPQLCFVNETCSVVKIGIEESSTGWIGDGGVPFRPLLLDDIDRSFFTIFSDNNGFWQIALVNLTTNRRTFLTSGNSVVTSLYGYDVAHQWIYFRAAYPLPRHRHVYRINLNSETPVPQENWECMTCSMDATRCGWVTPSYSPNLKYVAINCGGPDVPMSFLQEVDADGDYRPPELWYNNSHLIENKAQVKWPVKEYDSFKSSSEPGIDILYQMFKPIDFDPSKKYPLLIEVYGGPGYQKVQDRWTRSWAAIHMVSQYGLIVASLDARGSGYRGDGIMHLLYKKIGQLEKKDTTEFAQYLASQSWIDESRVALWGWSYGGYTTTFSISEGSGAFKCGFAVAPLATRLLYDSIHTERYMTMPNDNVDGYEKCSILNSNLTNFKIASYSIIHGTADDNVHFQNAALISKGLVEADVDFSSVFYADEAHSVNSGPNANKHIYGLLTRKVRVCFDLSPPSHNATIDTYLREHSVVTYKDHLNDPDFCDDCNSQIDY